ncbi:hypothetical protein [Acinetobacter puyangensis]|uniref:hypothetical protein n=1 Tax=Acinetobacter puyangensis TaxID=1096779 RepID=UPI003A4E42D0
MKYELILVTHGDYTIHLLALRDKNGIVTKMCDYNGNELKIWVNTAGKGKVTFNNKEWRF